MKAIPYPLAFNSTLTRDIPVPVNASIEALDNIPLSEVNGFKEVATPWYTDQVLPFDITLAAANEYGAAASGKVFGVEILNEGFGSSIDDTVLEMQATTVACLSYCTPSLMSLGNCCCTRCCFCSEELQALARPSRAEAGSKPEPTHPATARLACLRRRTPSS